MQRGPAICRSKKALSLPPSVPLPKRIKPQISSRSLMVAVHALFFHVYNTVDDGFRKYLVATCNADALTQKRKFDRLQCSRPAYRAGQETEVTSSSTPLKGKSTNASTRSCAKEGIV